MAHPHDSRIRPTDDLEVDVLGACRENDVLLIVSFTPPRLKVRPAQPGEEGPILIAKQGSPDARPIRAVRWKGVQQVAGAADGPVYLAADGGFTATKPKSKVRIVGQRIDGAVLLGNW